jgi:hypothetical protein
MLEKLRKNRRGARRDGGRWRARGGGDECPLGSTNAALKPDVATRAVRVPAHPDMALEFLGKLLDQT